MFMSGSPFEFCTIHFQTPEIHSVHTKSTIYYFNKNHAQNIVWSKLYVIGRLVFPGKISDNQKLHQLEQCTKTLTAINTAGE